MKPAKVAKAHRFTPSSISTTLAVSRLAAGRFSAKEKTMNDTKTRAALLKSFGIDETKECDECDTFGTSCCESSKMRQATATTLAGLVQRQGAEMDKLRAQLASAKATIEGMRKEIADHVRGVA
jgi:hypothetical protein